MRRLLTGAMKYFLACVVCATLASCGLQINPTASGAASANSRDATTYYPAYPWQSWSDYMRPDPGMSLYFVLASNRYGVDNSIPNWPSSSLIDGNALSVYSSPLQGPTNVDGSYVVARLATEQPIQTILVYPRLGADRKPLAFPRVMDIYLTNPQNSDWIPVAHYDQSSPSSSQMNPPANGSPLAIRLPQAMKTWGVLIIPQQYNTDGSNYYFQMGEIKLVRGPVSYNYRLLNPDGTPVVNHQFKVRDENYFLRASGLTDQNGGFEVTFAPNEGMSFTVSNDDYPMVNLAPQDNVNYILDPYLGISYVTYPREWNFVDLSGKRLPYAIPITVTDLTNPALNASGATDLSGRFFFTGNWNDKIRLSTPSGASALASGSSFQETYILDLASGTLAQKKSGVLFKNGYPFNTLAGQMVHIRDAAHPQYNRDVRSDGYGYFPFAVPMGDPCALSIDLTTAVADCSGTQTAFYFHEATGALNTVPGP